MTKKKEKKQYTVYYHTTPSGKRYVGITSTKVEERWKEDGFGYRTQPFYRAIEKYGWDNIEHHIYITGLDEENAKQWEMALIALWNTRDPKHGYNYTDGGDTSPTRTKEGIEKWKKSMKGYIPRWAYKSVICLETLTVYDSITQAEKDLHCRGISVVCQRKMDVKKHRFTIKGYHWAYYDENFPMSYYKKLLKQYIKEENETKKNNKVYKKVICLETLKVYQNMDEACLDTGAVKSTMCNCCKNTGRYNATGGYHWAYYDESKPKSYYKEILQKSKAEKCVKRPVVCIETGDVYESIADAIRKLNIPKSSSTHIHDCCNGRRHLAGGYHWKYYEKHKQSNKNMELQEKAVICLESLQVYKSIADARKFLGAKESGGHISECCKGKRLTAGGLHWSYYDETKTLEHYENLPKQVYHKAGRGVIQIETGKCYSTVKEAAKEFDASNGTHIIECCKGKRATAYGYHWEYAN